MALQVLEKHFLQKHVPLKWKEAHSSVLVVAIL